MASNYWTSTQFKLWAPVSKQYRRQVTLQEEHHHRDDDDNDKNNTATKQLPSSSSSSSAGSSMISFTETEKQMLIIHHIEMVHKWGEKLQLQQRVISTAIVFMRRFYVKNDITDCDPLLLAPTALLLACKIEECPLNYKTSIVKVLPSDYPYGMHLVIECEAYLMEQLNFNLSVYHGYKPLELYMRQLEQTMSPQLDMARNYQMCINFINDSYYSTTICLQYPPHSVALAAIYMCGILFDQSTTGDSEWLRKWFYDLNVDMIEIADIVDDMLQMYKMIHTLKTGDEIGIILLKIESVRREERKREQQQQKLLYQQPLQPDQSIPPVQPGQVYYHGPPPGGQQQPQQHQMVPPQQLQAPLHSMPMIPTQPHGMYLPSELNGQ